MEPIRRTICRYAQTIDDRDLEGWVALYASDGSHEINGRIHKGHAALRAHMRSAFELIGNLRHLVLGSNIQVAGTTASATTDWMTVRRTDGGTPVVASVGRFDDVLWRIDGEWRFARRIGTRWAGSPPGR